MISVLFVCVHNSARSQMAEAFLRAFTEGSVDVESAGLEPGTLNPVVVDVMREIGIDISANRTKSIDEFLRAGQRFDYVVTVCDETAAERCPVVPGTAARLHWSFDDPSSFAGDDDHRRARTRVVRDKIRDRVREFAASIAKPIRTA